MVMADADAHAVMVKDELHDELHVSRRQPGHFTLQLNST